MKTIITLLAATTFLAGASSAMAADVQASDEAAGYTLAHQSGWGGAYNSARGEVRNSTVTVPRAIADFQSVGSN